MSVVLAAIGLGGVPDDIKTWQTWLESLDHDTARWILFLAGILLFGAIWLWPRLRPAKEKRAAVVVPPDPPTPTPAPMGASGSLPGLLNPMTAGPDDIVPPRPSSPGRFHRALPTLSKRQIAILRRLHKEGPQRFLAAEKVTNLSLRELIQSGFLEELTSGSVDRVYGIHPDATDAVSEYFALADNGGARLQDRKLAPTQAGWMQSLGSAEVRKRLIDRLMSYRTEHANVRIVAWPARSVPVAQSLGAVFEMAGWKTDVNETPQEPVNLRYVGGLRIRGYNKHLVEAVSQSLIGAGLGGVVHSVERLSMVPENPKYKSAQQWIDIIVGNEE